MDTKNIFSLRLKELRLSKNMSQASMGEIIGIKAQAINDMEHGRIKTTIDRAIALADYFDVSLDYLVGRSDCPDMLVKGKDGNTIVIECMAPKD